VSEPETPCHDRSVEGSSWGGGGLRWYRHPSGMWWLTGMVCAWFFVFAGMFAAVGAGSAAARWALAPAGALAGAGAWLLLAGLRSGIGLGDAGVRVRNLAGLTRWVPWPEVARFEVICPPRWDGEVYAVAVVRRDGRRLFTAGCFLVGRRRSRELLQARAAEIAAVLETERAAFGFAQAPRP
jgi:hypothetical protein